MRKQFLSKRWSFLCLWMLVLYCTACGGAGQAPAKSAAPAKGVPTQPVSAQQLLEGPVTYVALGASDAVGVGSQLPGSQGYVPLLAERLPKGSHIVNLGISGIRLHEALSQELPLALSTSPRLITIWLVANDFVANVPYDSYMRDLDTLLKQLRSGTHARIVMANLPDLTHLPAFANLTSEQKTHMTAELQRWNAGIAALAGRYTVGIVDLYSQQSQLTSHPEYVGSDGFHPSAAGYVQLANDFWQVIKSQN